MVTQPVSTLPSPVLVVDDDRLIVAMLSDILSELGCTPLRATTFAEAEILLTNDPIMAFVDLNLPDGSGDQLCRLVRSRETRWDLPLVMITADQRPDVIQRCFLAGPDDLLLKPLDPDQVAAKVEAVRAGLGVHPLPKAPTRAAVLATERRPFAISLERLLRHAGYAVRTCSNASQAFPLLRADSPPDALIHDLPLDGPGLVLAREARDAGIPLLVLTSTPPDRSLGRHAYVHSPDDDPEQIVLRINAIVQSAKNPPQRGMKPRVPFHELVRFRLYGEHEEFTGFTFDLSKSGLFVRTLNPLAPGTLFEIAFYTDPLLSGLTSMARVAWCNLYRPRTAYSYPYGMGTFLAGVPSLWASRLEANVEKHTQH